MNNDDLLKKLQEKRFAHYKSLKKNDDHSHSIIGEQLYSKQSHFIFELLQNAEDESATSVKISFNNEKLVFEHNGRPFDIKDIESITSFGNNIRKKLKSNAIGRFGIGFKSVFYVTDKPEVQSGHFHFTISNFIIPNPIGSVRSRATIITLPFKKNQRSQIISNIENALDELDTTYLLFLNNIKSIEIENENIGDNRLIKLRRQKYKGSGINLINISEGDNYKEFLLFEETVNILKKKLIIKIAFTINRRKNKIDFSPIENSPLFAFFATEKESNLPFYVHAPFITTLARDNIVNDDYRNHKLLEGLKELMVKAIEQFKLNNLIDLDTWLVFPCDISFYKNEIYKLFCDKFFQYLNNKRTYILPSDSDEFCHVLSAMKGRSKEFKSFISREEIKILFGRTDWITDQITDSGYETIDKWIVQQFKVPTIGFKELCEKVDSSFFKRKSDEWLLRFYQCISDKSDLWKSGSRYSPEGPLRNKTFIRTSKNKTVRPYDDNGNPNVYLPNDGISDYQFVKTIFIDDKEARKLFKLLNISIPDLIAEVNEHVIPRIEKTAKNYRGLKEDVLKILRAIKKADDNDANIIIQKLKSISWLPGKNNLNRKISLYKPDEIYFPNRDLILFLGKTPTAIFIDSTIFSEKISKQNAKGIFEDLGIFSRPRRFYKQNDELIFENHNAQLQSFWNDADVELEGLNSFIKKPLDKKNSLLLWKVLNYSSEDWKGSGFGNTNFILQLKETKWLYNKYGQRLKPGDISPSELDESYESSDSLMDILEFKIDEIKNFELEYGGKFLSISEYQQIKDEIAELKKENERLKKLYEPSEEDDSENDLPDIDNIRIGDALTPDEELISDDDIPDDHQISNHYETNDYSLTGGNISKSMPTKRQNTIGRRGEEFVLKLLNEKYLEDKTIEIVNLNREDELGVGCDIIVKKNYIAKILIEVKSTEGGFENIFKISDKQWRTALKSHLDSEEPEYHLYCVYYAGGTDPQYVIVNDPVNWMLKNKLRFVEQWFNVRNIGG